MKRWKRNQDWKNKRKESMRPSLKAPEEIFLGKLNPIINNLKDNKTVVNKSEIAIILTNLKIKIDRFKYENARAGELTQLKTIMDNFVSLTTENETMMSFYERLMERADKSTDNKPIFQKIV